MTSDLTTKAAEIRAGLEGADEFDAPETMSPQDTARDLVDRFRSGDCPFCGHDPYHYVDNGVGMERVAVTCCDLGIALFQDRDEQLSRASGERHEAANALSDLLGLIEQQAAELAREQTKSARRLACMDRRADRLIELTDALAKVKTEYDGLLSTWAESRERHLAAEARATTAESERDSWRRVCERLETEKQAALAERDELLREKQRITRQLLALANALHGKHFANDAPNWQPLDDAEGLLSQIDNMTTGLSRAARSALENGPAGLGGSSHG